MQNSHTSRKLFRKKNQTNMMYVKKLWHFCIDIFYTNWFFSENSKPSTYLPNMQHTWKIVFDKIFGYRHKEFPWQCHLAQTVLN